MNLAELYLKAWIKKTYKLHSGTWNNTFGVRSYDWDDDTWVFTETDIDVHGISLEYVEQRLSEAGAHKLKDELYIFRTRQEAYIAVRVINDILFEFYRNGRRPISTS